MPKIIGVDEVNYSPSIAGDCLVAACYLKSEAPSGLLKDSKQTTERERLSAFAWLQPNSLYIVEMAAVNHLPELGIYKARNQAMWRAIVGLVGIVGNVDYVIVDGLEAWRKSFFAHNPFSELATYGLDNTRTVVKFVKDGDERVPAVSAASIIAKVYVDALFYGWATYYPDFKAMAKDHGACSREHLEALRRLGPTPIHRSRGYGEKWWKLINCGS